MIQLYDGGGAGVTEILDSALPEGDCSRLLQGVSRLLEARGHREAADILNQFQFELRTGSNYFNDEFCVLQAVVALDDYIRIEQLKAGAGREFKLIAETVSEIGPYTRFIVAALDTDEKTLPVSPPSPAVTSDLVERALADAERLLETQGAVSALDRAHTALHGYLRIILDRQEIPFEENSSATALFKSLRVNHPQMRPRGERREDVWRIVMGMATIIDSLNTLRNKASLAHPSENLLEDADAMLAINASRTLLHYLDARLSS